ncbi:organelle RRM domain-containing protein 2, mitochondrial-like [Macadamia integrifolia]|uniref:organelle RRM domain-containing protein 2, mitochondrial-like n=1 Tax=Macadamia integrifolia TaxID=60698 RepID=UPI001C4FBBDA|nr:organelle RRM domain-containing protein 2, mitochondrial-like [Macadamia integrifolia]
MAMRASAAAPRGLRRLYSSFAFASPPSTAANTTPLPAEPSTSLVVSSKCMTMRASAGAATPCGMRKLFSSFAFNPPPSTAANTASPPAEPSTNLFVSGLSKRTTSEGLRDAFSKFGQVVHARVVTDRVSGYSKGFGFVRYATLEEAAEGIKGMDGKFLDGWVIFAEYAKPREAPSSSPSMNAGVPPFGRP